MKDIEDEYIDYDMMCETLYENYKDEILEDVLNNIELSGESLNELTDMELEEIFKDSIYCRVSDEDIDEEIYEEIDRLTIYDSDCEDIINTYGLSNAVEEYIEEFGKPFSLRGCASLALYNSISWEKSDFRLSIFNYFIEEDTLRSIVKESIELYYDVSNLDDYCNKPLGDLSHIVQIKYK